MKKKMTYKIIAKYISDLEFNVPKTDTYLSLSKDISNYKFKIDIKSNRYKENIIEIQTTLTLVAKETDKNAIKALATFSVLVELDKNLKEKKELEEIILIKVPNEIYPELRNIFIFIFEKSGFKEINIEERVDFKSLYLSRKN